MFVVVKRPKPLPIRMLQILIAGLLSLVASDSVLFAQESQVEFVPLRAPKPKFEEPEFESVDPDSAFIPRSWFKNVTVAPLGTGILPDDVLAYFEILHHIQGVPTDNLVTAEREFRLERIEKFGERKREEFETQFPDETQRKRLVKELEKRLEVYRKNPFSYPLVRDAFNQAAECQGKVVSFSGHARRCVSFPAGENEYGFDELYEVWLFDEESNGYPVIIVCSELPAGFPINFPESETVDGVSVRGYYFKLYAYQGEEKYHAIPMILAKSIEWNPPPAVSRAIPPWVYGLAVLLGIIVLWLIFRSNRSTKPLRSVPPPEANPFP